VNEAKLLNGEVGEGEKDKKKKKKKKKETRKRKEETPPTETGNRAKTQHKHWGADHPIN
jgi:hypothetical protein